MRQRLRYVDITKGIAVISVVLYHTGFLPFQHQILPLITPWMLSVFAIVYGMTSSMPSDIYAIRPILYRRFRSTLIPYILYGSVSYMFWLGLRWYAPESVVFASWQDGLHQLLTGVGLVYNGPLWFLPPFFIAMMMYELLRVTRLLSHTVLAVCIAHALAFGAWQINRQGIQVMYSYDLSLLFVAFMCMGLVLKRIQLEKISWGTWIGMGVCFLYLCTVNGTVDIFGRLFQNHILYWSTAIIGSMIILRVAYLFEQIDGRIVRGIELCGKHSIILFSTHWPIMQWLTFCLWVLGGIGILDGVPTYTSFSYYHPSAVLFTLIELPLLVLYVAVPLCILPVYFWVKRAQLRYFGTISAE